MSQCRGKSPTLLSAPHAIAPQSSATKKSASDRPRGSSFPVNMPSLFVMFVARVAYQLERIERLQFGSLFARQYAPSDEYALFKVRHRVLFILPFAKVEFRKHKAVDEPACKERKTEKRAEHAEEERRQTQKDNGGGEERRGDECVAILMNVQTMPADDADDEQKENGGRRVLNRDMDLRPVACVESNRGFDRREFRAR